MKSFNPLSCLADQALSADAMITMRRKGLWAVALFLFLATAIRIASTVHLHPRVEMVIIICYFLLSTYGWHNRPKSYGYGFRRERKTVASLDMYVGIVAGSRRVLATAVDDWSGKPYCVSS
jgi:hypothetical protein